MMLLPVKADMITLSKYIRSSSEDASHTNLKAALVGKVYAVFKIVTTLFVNVLFTKSVPEIQAPTVTQVVPLKYCNQKSSPDSILKG